MNMWILRVTVAVCLTVAGAVSASAQGFGTFTFQMQPYCNLVTTTITQIPTGYTLDGFDDQCAAAKRASLVGMATLNPDGTVGVTFTIVTTPAGKGVHVSAVISPVTGSGTWTDSVGNTGTFVLAGAATGLPPRPLPASGIGASVITTSELAAGAVGASDIDSSQVQARVFGSCPEASYLRGINADGTVLCEPLDRSGPLRRLIFSTTTVPPAAINLATAVTLATMTFTPPVTGTALVSGRGGCLYNGGAASAQGVIGFALPGETSFPSFQEVTQITAPANSSLTFPTYNAERALAVTAGVTYTVHLKAYQSVGPANQFNCSGTVSARLHVGSIP